jgi:hypothetical protein
VDFATPARLATSFCPSFVRFIARLIAAILLSSSAMRGRCHGETALTSGNRVAPYRRPAAQKVEPCQRIDRRGESALGWLQKNGNRHHGAAGLLRHRTSHPPRPRLHPRPVARAPVPRVNAFRPRRVEPLARIALRARRGRPARWRGHLCAGDLAAEGDGAFQWLRPSAAKMIALTSSDL